MSSNLETTVNLKPTDRVALARDIHRVEGPYAQKGDTGTITEIFRPTPTGSGEVKAWHAKVRMDVDNRVKTFRLTSLEKA